MLRYETWEKEWIDSSDAPLEHVYLLSQFPAHSPFALQPNTYTGASTTNTTDFDASAQRLSTFANTHSPFNCAAPQATASTQHPQAQGQRYTYDFTAPLAPVHGNNTQKVAAVYHTIASADAASDHDSTYRYDEESDDDGDYLGTYHGHAPRGAQATAHDDNPLANAEVVITQLPPPGQGMQAPRYHTFRCA